MMLFAGGGVCGGNVIGASDPIGAEPVDAKQTTENFAATIYRALGIPTMVFGLTSMVVRTKSITASRLKV